MPFWNKNKPDPKEELRRKVRKKVRNQSRFLKHSLIYLVMFLFFALAAFLIREEEFVIPFLLVFTIWMIGLIFHGLSAFVFNRINSWEETRYQKKLADLRLQDGEEVNYHDKTMEEDVEDPMDLKSYDRLRKELDERWGEGDFV